jgi:hypothetical protein
MLATALIMAFVGLVAGMQVGGELRLKQIKAEHRDPVMTGEPYCTNWIKTSSEDVR